MTVMLLRWLQGVNNFQHVRLQNTIKRHLDTFEQVEYNNQFPFANVTKQFFGVSIGRVML